MKPGLYTRIVLTIIALMLTVIACKTVIRPDTTAHAQGPFAGVQFSGPNNDSFFDTRTGDLWEYRPAEHPSGMGSYPAQWTYLGTVTKLGQPLAGAPK